MIVATKIYKRFDSLHEFWSVFNASKPQKKKKLGYYDVNISTTPVF